VRFTDVEALKKALSIFGAVSVCEGKPGTYCLLATDTEDGTWPSFACVECEDEDHPDDEPMEQEIEFDPVELICPYLADGEVLVMMSGGHEKLRYITGNASAYIKSGLLCEVSLYDIYDKVNVALAGTEFTCTPCEY
jgi:hypothetical protein